MWRTTGRCCKRNRVKTHEIYNFFYVRALFHFDSFDSWELNLSLKRKKKSYPRVLTSTRVKWLPRDYRHDWLAYWLAVVFTALLSSIPTLNLSGKLAFARGVCLQYWYAFCIYLRYSVCQVIVIVDCRTRESTLHTVYIFIILANLITTDYPLAIVVCRINEHAPAAIQPSSLPKISNILVV